MQASQADLFLDSVYVMSHSRSTVISYRLSIKVLREFLNERYSIDEIQLIEKVKNDEIDIYSFLRDLVVYRDKKGNTARTIRTYMSGIKGYLRYLGIKISTDEYKQLVKSPRIVTVRDEPITKEMIVRLLHNSPPKLQTAILVAVASGMRIGEIVQLRLSDIDFRSIPTKIKIRSDTTKTRQSRETFITAEATKALKDYLTSNFGWKENENNSHLLNQIIFSRTMSNKIKYKHPENEKSCAQLCLQKSLQTHVEKIPELDMRNENGRKTIHFHGFRKYFRTTVGNVCGRDFAEALIGHGFYMDTYYVLSEEQKRELYLKAEPYLTISDFKAVEQNIKDLSEKYVKLEKVVSNLQDYLRTNSIEVPSSIISLN
ncbi:tyrosine-type recombinase/integrase [Candidatus Nitrosotenuis chungbukensis]|uniref:tyrosine-type recombinase/integrase n=1 Tax=Candidatus Nitrosotenuis chungbukensis TaxID=1353246 RepID=UPI0015A6690B|nr:tyrosine-type recombinase/integrase [Candidatus Nitrosotenuis chungbukensis]WKT58509.1 tyrosine-type recombinase/integrase [Candidatus Nitrosotenuis chungbukensis]